MHYNLFSCDYTVFIKRDETGSLCLILAYVDDLLFILSCKQRLDMEVSHSKQVRWNRGPFKFVPRSACCSTQWKAGAIADCINYSDTGVIWVDVLSNVRYNRELNFIDKVAMHKNDKMVYENKYQNMIGCLQFLTHLTKPDIVTAVGNLSQNYQTDRISW